MVKAIAEDVRLRPAGPQDCDLVLQWQTEPGARRYFRNLEPPQRAGHEAWYRERMALADPRFWIIEVNQRPVGLVRLDDSAHDRGFAVSILVTSLARGNGYATSALQRLREIMPSVRINAEISQGNAASRRAFEKAGFSAISDDLFVSDPTKGQ